MKISIESQPTGGVIMSEATEKIRVSLVDEKQRKIVSSSVQYADGPVFFFFHQESLVMIRPSSFDHKCTH